MYSLYRAWLSLGPMPALQGGLSTGSSLNLAPPSQLPGAPDVSLQVGPTLTNFSAHRAVLSAHSGFFKAALANHAGPSPIAVPNVNVDEFSSLLTFMYTGYLDLNVGNIYNTLLATHMLHMPKALELCRSFLINQSQAAATAAPPACHGVIKPIASRKSATPNQTICPPAYSNLKKSEATPFRAVANQSEPSTSAAANQQDGRREVQQQTQAAEKAVAKSKRKADGSGDKIVIDIACCDGPVRFHRVVNRNYGLAGANECDYRAAAVADEINRNAALNKVMNENIRDKRLSDENHQQQQPNAADMFTCLYCNHTFKSQYCYQKHARRHLNPVNLDQKAALKCEASSKREVKLLDMNVQYYPCKTCGSKFPSYYFVHKHRKMCHAEEMADTANKNNEIVAEKGEGGGGDSSDTTKSSAIDVEAVNQE